MNLFHIRTRLFQSVGHSHVAGLLYIVDIQVDFTVDYHCQNTSTKRTGRLCVSSVAKKMPIEFSVLEHAG
ncbi:unnamed protein product [Schistosoma guineensis]|nr:unnamed protein product [Schistosoma guineensis]